MIRYQGIRRVALLARPFITSHAQNDSAQNGSAQNNAINDTELAKSIALDWHSDILPLLTHHLEDLPKLRIDIHLPKDINI